MLTFLVTTMTGILTLFLYCYFGQLATEGFIQMSNVLYDSNWSHQSVQLQKCIVFMMSNMQKPLYFNGFGVANLNMRTFISV